MRWTSPQWKDTNCLRFSRNFLHFKMKTCHLQWSQEAAKVHTDCYNKCRLHQHVWASRAISRYCNYEKDKGNTNIYINKRDLTEIYWFIICVYRSMCVCVSKVMCVALFDRFMYVSMQCGIYNMHRMDTLDAGIIQWLRCYHHTCTPFYKQILQDVGKCNTHLLTQFPSKETKKEKRTDVKLH
jgi:hypothetical protein